MVREGRGHSRGVATAGRGQEAGRVTGWAPPGLRNHGKELDFYFKRTTSCGVTSGEKPQVLRYAAEGKAWSVDRGSAGQTRLRTRVWAQPWRWLLELEFTGPWMDSQEGEAGAPGLLPGVDC